VFDLITRRAAELCSSRGASIFEYDGELVHPRSRYHSNRQMATASAFRFGATEIAQASRFYAAFPMKPERGMLACRAILDSKSFTSAIRRPSRNCYQSIEIWEYGRSWQSHCCATSTPSVRSR
jgi:hypothetical protein